MATCPVLHIPAMCPGLQERTRCGTWDSEAPRTNVRVAPLPDYLEERSDEAGRTPRANVRVSLPRKSVRVSRRPRTNVPETPDKRPCKPGKESL